MKINNVKSVGTNFINDIKEFSLTVAFGRLARDIPFIPWNIRKNIYEKSIIRYLDKHYSKYVEKYVKDFDKSKCEKCDEKIIWTMWWQGTDNMPEIVAACYRQLLLNSGSAKVILITKDNYANYVKLPSIYIKKLSENKITTTHFSDLLRVELLKQYGGLWLDATVFADRIDESVFGQKLYSLNGYGMFPDFISRGAYQTFILGTDEKNSLFFNCISIIYERYWGEHNTVIDYLLFNYIIELLYRTFPQIKDLIDSCEKNYDFYKLNLHINDEFSKELLYSIFEGCPLQKLTYKKEFHTEINGKKTIYAHLTKK